MKSISSFLLVLAIQLSIIVFILCPGIHAQSQYGYRMTGVTTVINGRTLYNTIRDDILCSNLPMEPIWVQMNGGSTNNNDPITFLLPLPSSVSTDCLDVLTAHNIQQFVIPPSTVDLSCFDKCGDPSCLCPLSSQCEAVTPNTLNNDGGDGDEEGSTDNPCVSPYQCVHNQCVKTIPVYAVTIDFSRNQFTNMNLYTETGPVDGYFFARLFLALQSLSRDGCLSPRLLDILSPVTDSPRSYTFYTRQDTTKCSIDTLQAATLFANNFDLATLDMRSILKDLVASTYDLKSTPITITSVSHRTIRAYYPEQCMSAADPFAVQCYSSSQKQCDLPCPELTPCEADETVSYCGTHQKCRQVPLSAFVLGDDDVHLHRSSTNDVKALTTTTTIEMNASSTRDGVGEFSNPQNVKAMRHLMNVLNNNVSKYHYHHQQQHQQHNIHKLNNDDLSISLQQDQEPDPYFCTGLYTSTNSAMDSTHQGFMGMVLLTVITMVVMVVF